jgi:sulfur-carrier protein
MSAAPGPEQSRETVTVRYWAGARAAAGTAEDVLTVDGPTTLSAVVARVLETHPDPHLARVLEVCSVLVGDQPTGRRSRESVSVEPGMTIEFLPPFAGG